MGELLTFCEASAEAGTSVLYLKKRKTYYYKLT